MLSPTFTDLNYTYKKEDSDVWVLNTNDIPVEKSKINDQQLVHLAPLSVGGNHRHPRTEWFVAIGELLFVWLDENGVKHEEPMNPDGKLRLVMVPPFVPHAVVNQSSEKIGLLFDMADAPMSDVEKIAVA